MGRTTAPESPAVSATDFDGFPTVARCARYSGPARELLVELDHRVRNALIAASAEADDPRFSRSERRELQRACVTVLMSIVADAAVMSGGRDETQDRLNDLLALCESSYDWAENKSLSRCTTHDLAAYRAARDKKTLDNR